MVWVLARRNHHRQQSQNAPLSPPSYLDPQVLHQPRGSNRSVASWGSVSGPRLSSPCSPSSLLSSSPCSGSSDDHGSDCGGGFHDCDFSSESPLGFGFVCHGCGFASVGRTLSRPYWTLYRPCWTLNRPYLTLAHLFWTLNHPCLCQCPLSASPSHPLSALLLLSFPTPLSFCQPAASLPLCCWMVQQSVEDPP